MTLLPCETSKKTAGCVRGVGHSQPTFPVVSRRDGCETLGVGYIAHHPCGLPTRRARYERCGCFSPPSRGQPERRGARYARCGLHSPPSLWSAYETGCGAHGVGASAHHPSGETVRSGVARESVGASAYHPCGQTGQGVVRRVWQTSHTRDRAV